LTRRRSSGSAGSVLGDQPRDLLESAEGDVTIDPAALTFIDVGGLRALAQLAARLSGVIASPG